ncbi:WRKY DNA-binding transcription factor 70-like isoform X1 [Lycium ferocissimum]|uniref:WRKY DNA-binding transcription factor 70-like isoform X1 n=1 Tax=Lycium ferocissimum TaxID=112874 RepID=UPI0028153334|nr:WRKY DNA-binding transcription factor 70-like isoform X1 [Lycium ferocissimum]
MESQWPENSLAYMKMLINELNCGQELTNRLKEVINKPLCDRGKNLLAEDLVEKIMGSFCKTISILKSSKSIDEDSQVNPMVAVSSCWKGGRRSPDEDSTGSCKISSPKDQRGYNKRRKISVKNVKETSTLVDDGHVWRKYGQKQILDAPFPRNYYRCTYKFDQGCQATKQEQRIQANPPRFRTMYQGHHTCKTNYPTVSQILLDSQKDHDDSSTLLSFDSNTNYYYNPCFPTFPSTKKEIKKEVSLTCSYPNQHQIQSSSSDYFLPLEYDYSTLTAETSGHVKAALSSESDNGDFISSGSIYSFSTSTDQYCMEMDMMLGSINFGHLPFQF